LFLTSPDSDAICINRHNSKNRQRFKIAHEIGHLQLGHPSEPGEHVHVEKDVYISQRGRKASEGVDPKEIEANAFAACLLMPKTLLEESLEAPVNDARITALAKLFGVSEQAMILHLTRLGHL
jgi:Zn-dependent peptidase ImmA (M78 family)